MARQLLLNVFLEAAHGLEAVAAGIGPVFITGEEIDFALRQSLHQCNEGIGASAGGLGQGSIALSNKAGVAHNIAEVHYGEWAGLLLQRLTQQLQAGSGQIGLRGIAEQENGVGR